MGNAQVELEGKGVQGRRNGVLHTGPAFAAAADAPFSGPFKGGLSTMIRPGRAMPGRDRLVRWQKRRRMQVATLGYIPPSQMSWRRCTKDGQSARSCEATI